MSTELKAIKESTVAALSVTRFAGKGGAHLQLTQGVGSALKGEAGFVQVSKEQAVELIATLAQFVGGMSEEQFLESLHEEA